MPMTTAARGHALAVTLSAWGHAKAACALLAKIIRQRPVHATLFIVSSASTKAEKEFDFQFLPGAEDHLRKRIRVVALDACPVPFDHTPLNESFIKEYKKLIDSKNISAENKSVDESDAGPPQLVILDCYLYFDRLQSIRAVSGHTIPVYLLEAASVAMVLMRFSPGGRLPQLPEQLKAIPYTEQEAIHEEAAKIYTKTEGKLIRIPGMPPMYDHEFLPQEPMMPTLVPFFLADARKFYEECDGAVINSTTLYEGLSIKAFQEWFGERPAVCLGPYDFPVIKLQKASSPNTAEVEKFLDSMLEKYGQNSVVYVSLGSQYWPSKPENVWAILDVLIEQKVPFIFAHASRSAIVPDEVEERIKISGLGYSSNWLPQTTILGHKACGWILTHAGHNSVMEALAAGIPMVCWPFDADQPQNATNIAFVHNMGYELFEVRVEKGLLPIHRLGDWTPEGTVEAVKREFLKTIEKMKGDDGAVKRANAQKFREGLAKLWAPDGENWREMKRITDLLQ